MRPQQSQTPPNPPERPPSSPERAKIKEYACIQARDNEQTILMQVELELIAHLFKLIDSNIKIFQNTEYG